MPATHAGLQDDVYPSGADISDDSNEYGMPLTIGNASDSRHDCVAVMAEWRLGSLPQTQPKPLIELTRSFAPALNYPQTYPRQ